MHKWLMSNHYCSRQLRTATKRVILGAWVMGLYVSFPTAGLTCGLIFPAAGGVDTVTGSAFVKPDCPDVSFASSTFAGRVSTSWPPSPLRFLATGSFSSATGRRVVSEPPSFGWISLRIPWLVLISSIICRNINGQISQSTKSKTQEMLLDVIRESCCTS